MPTGRGTATRLEAQIALIPAATRTWALAAILSACLDDIENMIQPPEPVNRNLYDMSNEDRCAGHIGVLPGSLEEAICEMRESEFVRKLLGNHIFNKFIEAKLKECEGYKTQISKWEIDAYLKNY